MYFNIKIRTEGRYPRTMCSVIRNNLTLSPYLHPVNNPHKLCNPIRRRKLRGIRHLTNTNNNYKIRAQILFKTRLHHFPRSDTYRFAAILRDTVDRRAKIWATFHNAAALHHFERVTVGGQIELRNAAVKPANLAYDVDHNFELSIDSSTKVRTFSGAERPLFKGFTMFARIDALSEGTKVDVIGLVRQVAWLKRYGSMWCTTSGGFYREILLGDIYGQQVVLTVYGEAAEKCDEGMQNTVG